MKKLKNKKDLLLESIDIDNRALELVINNLEKEIHQLSNNVRKKEIILNELNNYIYNLNQLD